TTTTVSSEPALRTRYHVPKRSGPGTSTTNRAHRSPCPAPRLTGRLSPTSRETARSVHARVPGRPPLGKTGLTLSPDDLLYVPTCSTSTSPRRKCTAPRS